ncbi:UvrD-helicase domain-containing protein [Candidatus Nitrotoga sp. AM1P]|uniref:UvrD-helicase domain-containing protein n=1 Tax=Candidatus Nitrotoga sp. AM1P TaxID=2559597 RepID=UPI0010B9E767|nr:UvrD-helicase domain-containing protein [Candidatus Nitrotoga sp. AM1P]BBJ23070.1 DNA helicase [Candidatus Nitrotoga sp. AM1P]
MPAAFSVSEEDIAYAERILLNAGESFDSERREFIRNLDTVDLQAVPGSGKTTALLAKLLILDRHLPFEDGSGILVISHTNAAIDEIREQIGTHCASLFKHPNFVGTIQSFVNEFLAIPFFTNRYKKTPVRIDDDIYNQKFSKPPFNLAGFSAQESKNAKRYLMLNAKNLRWSLVNGKMNLTDEYGGKKIDFKKPRGNTKPVNYTDWSDDEKTKVCEWIFEFKLSMLKGGYLCYDDAYFLASASAAKNPQIKVMLQKRFMHVFVDEMQDMAQHQHSLLEDIFFDGGSSPCVYQRIGDKNQSIFDGKETLAQPFWNDRATVLQLNGSYRLSRMLANVVGSFAVSPLQIEGRRKNADGSDVAIKPHFLVFSDAKKEQVICLFASIIKTLVDEGKIPANPRNRYKAVAWATKKEDGKLRLCDYHPVFSRSEQQPKIDQPNLQSYIFHYNQEDRTLSSIEKNISNALLRILREEEVADITGAPYSKRKMCEFLKETKPDYWKTYEEKIYGWCLDVIRGNGNAVLLDIKNHLPGYLSQFDCTVNKSANFINDSNGSSASTATVAPKKSANILQYDGFDVEVSTVHSVKGETHTATLYMETFYEKGGGGNYESERLVNQLKGEAITATMHNRAKQSAKMVYVGFSRPTHLLCFAVHEIRFAKFEANIDQDVWQIVRL